MFVQSYRASKILYNFLKSNHFRKKFLLPSNVCTILPAVFSAAEVDFDFLDIENETMCLNRRQILDSAAEYEGVLFVRTYGTERNFNNFFNNLKGENSDFVIIDDACLCLPDLNDDLSANTDLKLYSLGYAKQVDLGEGAFGFVSEKWKYNELSDVNFENKNFEIDLKEFLTKKQQVQAHKQKLNAIYETNLPSEIQLSREFQNWRFNIIVEENKKQLILEALFREKLFASSHYKPLSTDNCKNAITLHNSVINLFNDCYYTENQALKTAEIINKFNTKNSVY